MGEERKPLSLAIQGAVPGAKSGWVTIKDSVKKKLPDDLPYPAALREAGVEDAPAETTVSDETETATEAPESAEKE